MNTIYNLGDKIKYHLQSTLELCDSSTIAYQYISQLNKCQLNSGNWKDFYKGQNSLPLPDIDYKLLRKVVDNTKSQKPRANAFAVHLRLGDKIKNGLDYKNLLFQCIDKYNLDSKYKHCRFYYGTHNNHDVDLSKKIIKDLQASFFNNFHITSELVSNTADSDFCDLSNEICFIPSEGGFSCLSASINPNFVIWDIFNVSKYHRFDKNQIDKCKDHQMKLSCNNT